MDFLVTYRCAVCGEENAVFVEPEGGSDQTLTEDCTVCCRPNVLRIRVEGERVRIQSTFEG